MFTRRRCLITIRVEVMRVVPVMGGCARFRVRRDNGAEARVSSTEKLCNSSERGDASAVGRDGAEQLHHETVKRREWVVVHLVRATRHRLFKQRADARISSHRVQVFHDVVERIAPLAERKEVVEALEDDVLIPKVLPLPTVFDPVVDKRLLRIGDLALAHILQTLVDPVLEPWTQFANKHVVVMDHLHCRVPVADDVHEPLANLPDFGWDVIPPDTEVKVPVHVEVIEVTLIVLLHQWLVDVLLVEELIEESFNLFGVHWTIQIRRERRVVDLLPLVVGPAIPIPLEEYRSPLLLHVRLPAVV